MANIWIIIYVCCISGLSLPLEGYYVGIIHEAECGEKPPLEVNPGEVNPSRVIGGVLADPGEWPWMASVQFEDDWFPGSYYHVCGGSLITVRWVLTAAHCVDSGVFGEGRDDPERYQILLGAHDLHSFSGVEQAIGLNSIVKHPDWIPASNQGYPNDIALLKLSLNADLTGSNVDIVCLPSLPYEDYTNQECWIKGWGLTVPNAPDFPNELHHGKTEVITNTECGRIMPHPILDTHICVGGNATPITCDGDSGGPLSCNVDESGQWELAGISSWTFGMCDGFPAVFTRVPMYLDWIDGVINGVGM